MEQIDTLDHTLFLKINGGADTPAWAIDGAVVIANDLIYLIPFVLVAMWLWGAEPRRNLAIRACMVALIGVGLNQIIGVLWQHPRPFMIGLGHMWLHHTPDSSFPSDHMTVFGGVAISLLLGGESLLGVTTLAIGLSVAWARIFLGVHFPMDMLGSFGVACLSYVALLPAWQKAGGDMTRALETCYRSILARPIAWGWVRR